jgi:glycosyltransferase involved in cell wall biosynthesis
MKENQPRITIITVCFNAQDTIEKTIRSVVEQTYGNLEYLIVDGASKDGTMSIVERYRDRIERGGGRIVSEPDKGLYDAMNKGVRLAGGEWFLLLNCDDVFVDERVVADVAAFIETHPEADIVYGNTEQVWEYGTIVSAPAEAYRNRKMCISPQATFVRTALHLSHPFNLKYRFAADFEQSTTFALEGRTFLHFDRLISRVELASGVTHENHYASEKEIYDILESQGFDVRGERRRKLRHIQQVAFFKRHFPRWIVNPVMRAIAKYYKPM